MFSQHLLHSSLYNRAPNFTFNFITIEGLFLLSEQACHYTLSALDTVSRYPLGDMFSFKFDVPFVK